jgi:hypothetical protein
MKGLNERYLALEAKGLRPGEPGGSRVDPPWVPIVACPRGVNTA